MRSLILTFPALVICAYYSVPQQAGHYGVSIEDVVLTDHNLPDPYLNISSRRIIASIISSTGPSSECVPVVQPYMPLPVAQFWEQAIYELLPWDFNYTLSETTLQLCKPVCRNTSQPLVLFAPGAGIARQLYHIMMINLVAQTGYTVVTYEQPGYVDYEWFPDGEAELPQQNFTFGGPVRTLVDDAIFILDIFNSTKAAMWGHSEGGEVAGGAVVHDVRLLGGIDLDGGFYSNYTLLNYTSSTPFALFSRTGHDQADSLTPWTTVWENLKGDKWQLQLNSSTHLSFSDAPYLVRDLYDFPDRVNDTDIVDAIGAIPGDIAIRVIPAMAAKFFSFVFGMASAVSVTQTASSLGWFKIQNVTIV